MLNIKMCCFAFILCECTKLNILDLLINEKIRNKWSIIMLFLYFLRTMKKYAKMKQKIGSLKKYEVLCNNNIVTLPGERKCTRKGTYFVHGYEIQQCTTAQQQAIEENEQKHLLMRKKKLHFEYGCRDTPLQNGP